jgi:hypothetical protein
MEFIRVDPRGPKGGSTVKIPGIDLNGYGYSWYFSNEEVMVE